MGNETSKKMLLIEDGDVPKKKGFSLTRSISHDNQMKGKNFDISEKELRELRATYNQNNPAKYNPEASKLGDITPYYPPLCLVR